MSEFKVGDKVKVIRDPSEDADASALCKQLNLIGQQGRIVEHGMFCWVRVQFGNKALCWFPWSGLEKVKD